MVIWVTEIKLRAERRVGELLRETADGHRRQTQKRDGSTVSSRGDTVPKLKDLGISRDQSSDWQKLAELPQRPSSRSASNMRLAIPKTMTTATPLCERCSAPSGNTFQPGYG